MHPLRDIDVGRRAIVGRGADPARLTRFSKALAAEGAEKGLRVNVVAPGPVWTPLIPATMPEEKAQQFGQDSPLGRPAQPAELAPLFVFLASAESAYITGEVVGVTGGNPLPESLLPL